MGGSLLLWQGEHLGQARLGQGAQLEVSCPHQAQRDNKVGKDGSEGPLAAPQRLRSSHLTVQTHLHGAYVPRVLINAEELGAALLQDGVPQGCVVGFWVISICGLGPGHVGA